MKEVIRKIKLIFRVGKRMPPKIRQKAMAQSMVEFAVLLPILLVLFTGMVEFGFMLNTYLSLLDATRQAAREYSNTNPFKIDPITKLKVYDENFGPNVAQAVIDSLMPPSDPSARQIAIDSGRDDILVSVIGIQVTDKSTVPYTTSIIRSTTEVGTPVDFYNKFGNYNEDAITADNTPPGKTTKYSNTKLNEYLSLNGTNPVNNGLLIVEIYYSYEGVLKLPWIEFFASDSDPIMLYSSTIMPLVAVRPPDATPTP